MAAPYLDSPATERDEQSRLDENHFDVDFSMAPSFASPAKRDDDLLSRITGMGGADKGNRILATPRSRQPLGDRRNPPAKSEFTPLLKSAAANRLKLLNGDVKGNVLRTPAALKPGFKLDATPLPELSTMDSSSVVEDEGTPVPAVASSSLDLSTPMALPRRDAGGLGDGGNVLTLREQEAKLEQIDKENFGLKLKIHFLEENLKRTGPEANHIAIRENSELQANKMLMERELKKYQKHLKTADQELEQYRQQLLDYADKIKRRHLSEEMQEEMAELRQRAEEQESKTRSLQEQLEQASRDDEEIERLQGDLDDAEREIREKSERIDKQEEELKELRDQAGDRGDDNELQEQNKLLEEQTDQLEELRDELRRTTEQKDKELDQLEDRLAQESEEHDQAMQEMQTQVERSEDAKSRLEAQLQTENRDEEIRVLRDQIQSLEQQRDDEVQSLESRLRLAESGWNQQTQLAHQVERDAAEALERLARDKESEIAEMNKKLDLAGNTQTDFDETKKQMLHQFEEAKALRKKNERQSEEMDGLTAKLGNLNTELAALRSVAKERDDTLQQVATLRQALEVSERKIDSLKMASEADTGPASQLQKAQADVADRERQVTTLKTTLQERTAELEALRELENEPDSQLEAVNNIVRERSNELEALRDSYDDAQSKLDAVQKLADERNAALLALREELATTKQNLEDEVQVLETSLDESEQAKESLQERLNCMEKEIAASYELRHKIEPLEKELRRAERDSDNLQDDIKVLERDLEVADQERTSMQDKIKSLTKDLDASREAAGGRSPRSLREVAEKTLALQEQVNTLKLQLADKQDQLADAETKLALRSSPSSARKLQQEYDVLKAKLEVRDRELKAVDQLAQEKLQQMEKKHAEEARQKQNLLRATVAELETVRKRVSEKEARSEAINAETTALLREKDRKLHALQQERRNSKYQAQETQTLQLEVAGLRTKEREVTKLRDELINNEHRHAQELKGLARQIQWLRAQGSREAGFREMLCYEKRWMNMQINIFGACNKENLRLLQDMGIHPDLTIHERRPRLKTVGLAVIAAIRMKKWQREWAASKELHKSLIKKLESMRRGGRRKSITAR